MPAIKEISDKNFQKLLDAKEDLGYESMDEVLEDILDFWLTFTDYTKRGYEKTRPNLRK